MALSAKEAARELGTDARTFRKFMRAITPKEDQPGQGNRYAIEEKQLKKLRKQFTDWSAPKAKEDEGNGEVTKPKAKKSKVEEAIDITDDVEIEFEDAELEITEDDEPTDAELMSLEEGIDDLLDGDVLDLDV
jgi:hypothetical protein